MPLPPPKPSPSTTPTRPSPRATSSSAPTPPRQAWNKSAEEIVEQVVIKAQEVEAHAVVIDSIEVIFAGTTYTTDVEHDDYGYTERHRTSDRRVKILRATFLRRADN